MISKLKKEPKRDHFMLVSKTPTSWNNVPLDEITVPMIQRRFDAYAKEYSIGCNRWLSSLSAMLQSAWRKGYVKENCARKVKKLPENPPRSRVLDDQEMTRLLEAVNALESPHDRMLIQLLVTTGCRVSEALRLRWDARTECTQGERSHYAPFSSCESLEMHRIGRFEEWGKYPRPFVILQHSRPFTVKTWSRDFLK